MPQNMSGTGFIADELQLPDTLSEKARRLSEKAYVLLAGKKAGFLYDKELGSMLISMLGGGAAASELEAQARSALAPLPELEVMGVSLENGELEVLISSGDEEFRLNIQGGQ